MKILEKIATDLRERSDEACNVKMSNALQQFKSELKALSPCISSLLFFRVVYLSAAYVCAKAIETIASI